MVVRDPATEIEYRNRGIGALATLGVVASTYSERRCFCGVGTYRHLLCPIQSGCSTHFDVVTTT